MGKAIPGVIIVIVGMWLFIHNVYTFPNSFDEYYNSVANHNIIQGKIKEENDNINDNIVIKAKILDKNKDVDNIIPEYYNINMEVEIKKTRYLPYKYQMVLKKNMLLLNYSVDYENWKFKGLEPLEIFKFVNNHKCLNKKEYFYLKKYDKNIFDNLFKCDKDIWIYWDINYINCNSIDNGFNITTPDKVYILSKNIIAFISNSNYLHIFNTNKNKIILNNPNDNLIVPLSNTDNIKVKQWNIVVKTKDNKLFVYSDNKVLYNQKFWLWEIEKIKDISSDKKNVYILILLDNNKYISFKINKINKINKRITIIKKWNY